LEFPDQEISHLQELIALHIEMLLLYDNQGHTLAWIINIFDHLMLEGASGFGESPF